MRFVFVIALYHVFSRQRKAALKGIVPGKATKARAVFYGLKHLALHVKEKVNIGINVHAVWRAWSPTRAYEAFPDLYQGLDFEGRLTLMRPGRPFKLTRTGWPKPLHMSPGMK